MQVHGLSKATAYNGARGTIMCSDSERVRVKLVSGDAINVKKNNLCSVFCIGLPRECRILVEHTFGKEAFARAMDEVDSSKFYVMYMGQTKSADRPVQHFLRVRLQFFKMAMTIIAQQDREPLMRFYLADYSQSDPGAKIQFGDAMPRPAESPAFADISSELVQELCMIHLTSPLDLVERNMAQEIERTTHVTTCDGPSQNKCGTKRK